MSMLFNQFCKRSPPPQWIRDGEQRAEPQLE